MRLLDKLIFALIAAFLIIMYWYGISQAHTSCFWRHEQGKYTRVYGTKMCGYIQLQKIFSEDSNMWRGVFIDVEGQPHFSPIVQLREKHLCADFMKEWGRINDTCVEE